MPIVHDPKTGQFVRGAGGSGGSGGKKSKIPEGLSESQGAQYNNFMSHSTKVVKARYISMLKRSSRITGNPDPEPKSRMAYKLAKNGEGIQGKL